MLKKIKKILIYILAVFFCVSFTYWKDDVITLTDYKKYKIKLQDFDINLLKQKNIDTLKTYRDKANCNISIYTHYYIVTPICLLKSTPELTFKESVDILWPLIKDFDKKYDLESTSFLYDTALPEFEKMVEPLDQYIGNDKKDKLLLTLLHMLDKKIYIPKTYIAMNNFKNYSFFISSKSLENRWGCRKENYLIAIRLLEDKLLFPSEVFNYNTELIWKKYCKYKTTWNYLFYGWVCGASTQLFRNALINPYIYITKRTNHSQRWVNFYSENVYWDDASVYEKQKQFEIRNIWENPIYFKLFSLWNNQDLVSIYPDKNIYTTHILKKQVWKLQATVWKSVFLWHNHTKWYDQFWLSTYGSLNFEKD